MEKEAGSIIPEELELQVEDNERERYGFTTNLDWRASAVTSLFASALYTRTREVSSNSEYEFGPLCKQLAIWDFSATSTRGTADRDGPDVTFETAGDDEERLSSAFDVGPYFFTIDPDDTGFIANANNYPLALRQLAVGIEYGKHVDRGDEPAHQLAARRQGCAVQAGRQDPGALQGHR